MEANTASRGGVLLVLVLAYLAYGLIQIYAGYVGIEHHLGNGWAIAAIAAAFLLRLMLPLTIGSFFCAMNVWGWHWSLALLFAAPGLLFVALLVPGFLAALIGRLRA